MEKNKVKLTELGLTQVGCEKTIDVGNTTITVVDKLPYEEVLNMIQWSLQFVVNEHGYISGPVKEMMTDMVIISFYTDLDMSMLFDATATVQSLYETYDLLDNHNVFNLVKKEINQEQLQFFYRTLDTTLNSILAYNTSALGVMSALSDNANELSGNMEKAMSLINDPQKLAEAKKFVDMMVVENTEK